MSTLPVSVGLDKREVGANPLVVYLFLDFREKEESVHQKLSRQNGPLAIRCGAPLLAQWWATLCSWKNGAVADYVKRAPTSPEVFPETKPHSGRHIAYFSWYEGGWTCGKGLVHEVDSTNQWLHDPSRFQEVGMERHSASERPRNQEGKSFQGSVELWTPAQCHCEGCMVSATTGKAVLCEWAL